MSPLTDSASVRDDITDLGHSEVFDDSLSEHKKVVIDPRIPLEKDDKDYQPKSKPVLQFTPRTVRKSSDPTDKLPKSPHYKAVTRNFNFPSEFRDDITSPPERTTSGHKSHRSGRKKRSKHDKQPKDKLQKESENYRERCDSDLSDVLKHDSIIFNNRKLAQLHKEQLEEDDDSDQPLIPKKKEKREKHHHHKHKNGESPSKSKHKRDLPILTMSDLHNRKSGEGGQTNGYTKFDEHKRTKSLETKVKPRKPEVEEEDKDPQSIPVIKVSNIDFYNVFNYSIYLKILGTVKFNI